MNRPLALWLVPCAEDKKWLSEIISTLSTQYHAPLFEPHITLYGGRCTPSSSLSEIMQGIRLKSNVLSLDIQSIDSSDSLFKSLYLRFDTCSTLENLSQGFQNQLVDSEPYSLTPHLSLIYTQLTAKQRQKIISAMNFSYSKIGFNELKVVTPRSENWRDFNSWEIIQTISIAA